MFSANPLKPSTLSKALSSLVWLHGRACLEQRPPGVPSHLHSPPFSYVAMEIPLPSGCRTNRAFLGGIRCKFLVKLKLVPTSSKPNLPIQPWLLSNNTYLLLQQLPKWKSGSFRITFAQQLAKTVQTPWRNGGKLPQLMLNRIHRRFRSCSCPFPSALPLPSLFPALTVWTEELHPKSSQHGAMWGYLARNDFHRNHTCKWFYK